MKVAKWKNLQEGKEVIISKEEEKVKEREVEDKGKWSEMMLRSVRMEERMGWC